MLYGCAKFFDLQVGGMAAGVFLLAMMVAAGPMPLDDRCTLPWC